jgi:succinyl-diaminopimelate desuccinylase
MYSRGAASAGAARASASNRARNPTRSTVAPYPHACARRADDPAATVILGRNVDERSTCERLITYDTSTLEGMQSAAGFVKGWLEARDVEVKGSYHNGRPVLAATVGPPGGLTVVLHGHLDVVPGRAEQFVPRVEGDRLYGRGAYDMKGGLAGMMCAVRELSEQDQVRVHFVCVSDEESEELDQRGSDYLVEQGYLGDFAITGEPTDMHIGIQAKGVLAMRIEVSGKAAHGSTPWAGDNAVLKAIDVFRQIESLPFSRESSELFDRPSINLGRILGGDALNKVPDLCVIDVDVRYLPGQDPQQIRASVDELPDAQVMKIFHRNPAIVARENPFVQALGKAISNVAPPKRDQMSVGRDGASDAISFLEAGVPAVEFGPTGEGHHGPEEWVSIRSLGHYRKALVEFVKLLPSRLEAPGEEPRLRIA